MHAVQATKQIDDKGETWVGSLKPLRTQLYIVCDYNYILLYSDY